MRQNDTEKDGQRCDRMTQRQMDTETEMRQDDTEIDGHRDRDETE